MKIRVCLILSIISIACITPVFAGLTSANNNYINDFIGDRALGLGGAFTAISDDPSGSYYNPAGLAFAYDNQISLSVNTYKTKKLKFDNAIGGTNAYNQKLSSFYPSFFGLVQSVGSLKIAFTVVNINSENLDQDDHYYNMTFYSNGTPLTVDYHVNFNNTDITTMAGPSVGAFLTKNITIGGTIYGLRREQQQIFNEVIRVIKDPTGGLPAETYQQTNNYTTDTSYGLYGRAGVQWMPTNVYSLGFSLAGGTFFSFNRAQQNFSVLNPSTFDKTGFKTSESDLSGNTGIPIEARLGFAWLPSKKFMLSTDLIGDYAWSNRNYSTRVKKFTPNIAVGAEYYLTNALPVRFGVFTNFASTDAVDESKTQDASKSLTGDETHVNLYGMSLSFSWQTKGSSVTLGGFYQTGKGKSQIRTSDSNQKFDTQDVSISMMQFSLTGSAKY